MISGDLDSPPPAVRRAILDAATLGAALDIEPGCVVVRVLCEGFEVRLPTRAGASAGERWGIGLALARATLEAVAEDWAAPPNGCRA